MPLDEALLDLHRGFRDERAGISEEFLQPRLGSAGTVAVLSRPLGPARTTGFVICHSFGLEQVKLHRLEVVAARELAAAGFPTLRFFVQGYGDSERRGVAPEVSWHLDATADAVSWMGGGGGGADRVGVLGVRFGALVAAVTADRLGLGMLGLWQPFVSGLAFLSDFRQTALFETMLDEAVDARPAQTPAHGSRPGVRFAEGFGDEGWKDLNGFRLSRRALEDIAAIDMREDLRAFRGRALVTGLSRSGSLPVAVAEVASHLRSIGTACTEVAIRDDSAHMLGQHQFKKLGDGEVERDIFHHGFRAVAAATAQWALGPDPPNESEGAAPEAADAS